MSIRQQEITISVSAPQEDNDCGITDFLSTRTASVNDSGSEDDAATQPRVQFVPVPNQTGNACLRSMHVSLQQVDGFNEQQHRKARHEERSRRYRRNTSRLDTQDDDQSHRPGRVRPSHVSQVTESGSGDINAAQYRLQIQQHCSDLIYMRNELHDAARNDTIHRLEVLCEIIGKAGQHLSDDQWLGEAFGESALAIAVAHNCTDGAKVLIDAGKEILVRKTYATAKYPKLSSLHLAIIRQNVELMDYMLKNMTSTGKKELLGSMASGEEKADYLTVPLPLAVDKGNLDVVYNLLAHDADLLVKDGKTGNTVLHHLATIGDKSPMKAIGTLFGILNSDEAELWWIAHRNKDDCESLAHVMLRTKNDAGHTPMSYAVQLCATEYAAAILNMENLYSFARWDVDPEHDKWYEVSEIDPVVAKHDSVAFSVLEMFTYFPSDRNVTLGELPHIKKVIEHKWNLYRGWLIAWFIFHTIVMTTFTVYCTQARMLPFFGKNIAINRSDVTGYDLNITTLTPTTNLFFQILEVFVVFVALAYFVLDIRESFTIFSTHSCWSCHNPGVNADFSTRIKLVIHQFDMIRSMLFCFSCSVPIMFVLRIVDSPVKDIFYALAAISGWLFILFFIRAIRNIGIFTAIVYRMILRELTSIIVIIFICVLAFGTGLYCLFNLNYDSIKPRQVWTPPETYYHLSKVTVGLEEFDFMDNASVPWLAKLTFVLFILLCHILLLNVLIAAMNNTYNELSDMKDIIWLQILAKAILCIERRLPSCLLPKHGLKRIDRGRHYSSMWYLGCEVTEEDRPWKKF